MTYQANRKELGPLALQWLLVALVIATIGGCIADIAGGTGSALLVPVVDKTYTPEHSTVTCDDDGCTTHRYPEHWDLTMDNDGMLIGSEVSHSLYLSVTNGQMVTVRGRFGRWTRHFYAGRVER